jgi:Xaa-Pro aminopeptidase
MPDVEPVLHFTMDEYAARIAKVRRAMEAKGIELLIASDPSNMAWLTGYDGWSFYVHQCVLLGQEGDPVWYGRGQDANGARRTAFMGDDDIVGYPDHYVQSEVRHPMDYLAERIVERGWGHARIGVEMDNYSRRSASRPARAGSGATLARAATGAVGAASAGPGPPAAASRAATSVAPRSASPGSTSTRPSAVAISRNQSWLRWPAPIGWSGFNFGA